MSAEHKFGSRAQQFNRRHESFLSLWAEGLHPLEIGLRLNINDMQLGKRCLRAFQDNAPRKMPEYDCLLWKDLHPVLRKALPCTDAKALVKVEVEGDGVILTLISATSLDFENLVV